MGLRIFCISRDKFTCFFSLNIGIGNEIVLDRLFPKGEIEQFNKNGNKFGLLLVVFPCILQYSYFRFSVYCIRKMRRLQ